MARDNAKDAKVFKAFCNEYRLQVLERLRTGEKCACDLLENIDISQSNLSHHMKILVESGIVSARQEGKWTYYSISPEGARAAMRLLEELTEVHGGKRCSC
ncbi:MAG: ArsR/SmtB family transcription factor [Eggerthellaceae bacterium]